MKLNKEWKLILENKYNKKIGQPGIEGTPSTYNKLRVWNRKEKDKHSACLTIKCGCCDERVHIYYDLKKPFNDTLEINGVFASKEEWRRILLPLLED